MLFCIRIVLMIWIYYQGVFCECVQPMRDDVASYRRLPLVGRIHKMIPVLLIDKGLISLTYSHPWFGFNANIMFLWNKLQQSDRFKLYAHAKTTLLWYPGVACEFFCIDLMAWNWATTELNFCRILNANQQTVGEIGPIIAFSMTKGPFR